MPLSVEKQVLRYQHFMKQVQGDKALTQPEMRAAANHSIELLKELAQTVESEGVKFYDLTMKERNEVEVRKVKEWIKNFEAKSKGGREIPAQELIEAFANLSVHSY
jgi:ribosome biogenesis SPOUT family RNA methylase Rps3